MASIVYGDPTDPSTVSVHKASRWDALTGQHVVTTSIYVGNVYSGSWDGWLGLDGYEEVFAKLLSLGFVTM